MFPLGMTEVIVLAVVGILLFGNRLPEIARSLGRSVIEFKKGFQGMEDEVHHTLATK